MARQKTTPAKDPKATKPTKATKTASAKSVPDAGIAPGMAPGLAPGLTPAGLSGAGAADELDVPLGLDGADAADDADEESDEDEADEADEAGDEGGEVPLPKPRPLVALKPPPPPRRETGSPTLGLVADSATPWTVRAGQTTKLRLTVVNTGGPARGLWVELGGQALTGGHVAGMKASAGEVAVLAPRALLPTANIEAIEIRDVKDKLPPAPKPTTTVEVEVRGVAKGKALLTVRVGPMTPKGPASSGSALCGRAIDVTD